MKTKIRITGKVKYLILPLRVFAFSLILILLSAAPGKSQETSLPKGWYSGGMGSGYSTKLDSKVFQNGQNSALLESVNESQSDFYTLMQTMTVKDFSGKRVKMTGFIKSEGTNVMGSMWIRIDDIGNKVTADFDNMMDRPVTGNSDWTKCEIVFDVPEKCAIAFGFILSGTGKIWVDNVSFEIVSSTTPKTANNLNQPFPEEYLSQLKEMPQEIPDRPAVNLDFEEITNAKP